MKKALLASAIALTIGALTVSTPSAQQTTIDRAKKEGEVVVWAHTWAHGTLLDTFQQRYPFLKVKLWNLPGGSREIPNRMIEEAKADRFTPDVVVLSTYGLVVLREAGLLREYDWPDHVKKWKYQPEGEFWVNHAFSMRVPTYNTKTISGKEAPKSWDDLKDPKWKGKAVISSSSPDTPLLFAYLWRDKGGELNWEKSFGFWSEVIKNTRPKVVRGFIAPNELHAAGEHPLFLLNTQNWIQYRERGASVRPVSVGTTIGSTWGIGMPKTVPHPNAASLFIDYFVSPEALILYSEAEPVAVLDPRAAKKAKGNVELKRMGIDWISLPIELRSSENLRKATTWWASTLGVKRGRKKR